MNMKCAGKVCLAASCIKEAKRRGYCDSHYVRFLRHGDPLKGRSSRTPIGEPLRFVEVVALRHIAKSCLQWPFGKYPSGYSKMLVSGKDSTASRYICERIHGAAPTPAHEAAHSCGDRACVNPNHITWKTPVENNADKLIHGTHNRGERHSLVKLTEQDVREIRLLKGVESERALAARYGVSNTAIHLIYRRKNWAWLDQGENAA